MVVLNFGSKRTESTGVRRYRPDKDEEEGMRTPLRVHFEGVLCPRLTQPTS